MCLEIARNCQECSAKICFYRGELRHTTFSPIKATSHTKHCETHYEELLPVLHSKRHRRSILKYLGFCISLILACTM